MSYQFVFWRTERRLEAEQVYAQLMEGRPVEGLDELDLHAVEAAIDAAFPEFVRSGSIVGEARAVYSGPDTGMEVDATPQSVTCTCIGMDEDDGNRLIDVFIVLRLPLYDPQTRERFDRIGTGAAIDDPDELHALAMKAIAHALDSIPPRGPFWPFALVEDETGVQLVRVVGDRLEEMLAGVRERVASTSPRRAVVTWDGFTTHTGRRLDAVVVEAYESGASGGIVIAQPYRGRG